MKINKYIAISTFACIQYLAGAVAIAAPPVSSPIIATIMGPMRLHYKSVGNYKVNLTRVPVKGAPAVIRITYSWHGDQRLTYGTPTSNPCAINFTDPHATSFPKSCGINCDGNVISASGLSEPYKAAATLSIYK